MAVGLFLFRRDFRYNDNTSLIELSKKVSIIYPVFNYDSIQADPKINKWFSEKSFKFMQECINSMNPPLIITHNDIISSLELLKKKYAFSHIGFNIEYTDFGIARDNMIASWCKSNDINVITMHDIKLIPNAPLTTQLNNYRKFTPFYNKCIAILNKMNVVVNKTDILHMIYDNSKKKDHINTRSIVKLPDNSELDNENGMQGANISEYLKYGILSIREVYHKYINNEYIVRQLLWRDFYYGLKMTKAYSNKLTIIENPHLFSLWKEGKTGVPLVDAGMRELNATGKMANRVRLITASYLIKNLQLDWQLGEHYFATKLIDYDPLINNGNWAWVAGISDRSSQRPMIKFNPATQLKKYDPECTYVKKWLPELDGIPTTAIINGSFMY